MADSETPTPVTKKPIEELRPLAAVVTIAGEKVITSGTIILDPTQVSFTLRWGSININCVISVSETEINSTVSVSSGEINIILYVTRNADLYVKFKNTLLYGGNEAHLSIFLRNQLGVEPPARIVAYEVSATATRLA